MPFSGRILHDIFNTSLWKLESNEHQQLWVKRIGYSMYRMDIWAHNRTIDSFNTQKYQLYKDQHGLQNNQNCKLCNIQKVIIQRWISNFDQQ